MNKYLIANKNQLVSYIWAQLPNKTLVKLHKSLYLLYAFYGATYGKSPDYPTYLFNAKFIAGAYGPLEKDIFKLNTSKTEIKISQELIIATKSKKYAEDINSFIQNIINQATKLDDFSLAQRTQKDKKDKGPWKWDKNIVSYKIDDFVLTAWYQNGKLITTHC